VKILRRIAKEKYGFSFDLFVIFDLVLNLIDAKRQEGKWHIILNQLNYLEALMKELMKPENLAEALAIFNFAISSMLQS
jgi:hypothetical protein